MRRRTGASISARRIAAAASWSFMPRRFLLLMLLAACGGAPTYTDAGGADADEAAATWNGASDIDAADGAVYHAEFVFTRGGDGAWTVASGTIAILQPPMSTCPTTIDASHDIGAHDGQLSDDGSEIRGEGSTVWEATYTMTCPGQPPQTTMLPYGAYWWPAPPSGPPAVPIVGDTLTFDVDGIGGRGTVTLSRS
jgi:hypothetical protein